MKRRLGIGKQRFDSMRENGCFLVDKTSFIRAWWESGADVTLVCRPRRFGKTLTLSMGERFFSTAYAQRGEELFGGLDVWDDRDLRDRQGTLPTFMVSFADVKGESFDELRAAILDELARAWRTHAGDIDSTCLGEYERGLLRGSVTSVDPTRAARALKRLCELLYEATGKATLLLIDEYDTPLQEAWLGGCWHQMVPFVRRIFYSTLKTNPYLERALVTGITRVAPESIFGDVNNLKVIGTFADTYATSFGFTEHEVACALSEYGLESLYEVKRWYDGFSFGGATHIFNPWSSTNYLDSREFEAYWANTSSNGLVDALVRAGDESLKSDFETLLAGGSISKDISESIVFQDLAVDDDAVWNLLLASGYVRADNARRVNGAVRCDLTLTNHEIQVCFDALVRRWFKAVKRSYNEFVRALLAGDARAMTRLITDVALRTFSSFDSGTKPSEEQKPERFWHGFVLGLLVELRQTHQVLSNRESGYGRYDTLIIPHDTADVATVIEFKVVDAFEGELTLEDAVKSALAQIERLAYDAELKDRGFASERIRHFGVAFQGKRVLVG